MTQEDKNLLLKDLCARLPYYPKCEMTDEIRVVNNEKDPSYISTLFPKYIELFSYHNNFTIKPYLRPMSSMTEEEKEQIRDFWIDADVKTHATQLIDFYNKYHFDYRGLIEKGLALEAPSGMY